MTIPKKSLRKAANTPAKAKMAKLNARPTNVISKRLLTGSGEELPKES